MAYLTFRNRAQRNAALELPGDGYRSLNLRSFIGRSLSLEPRRESWVEIQDGRIDGLVGVRARLGTDFWDIDHLVATSPDAESVYVNMLRHLSRAASEEGVQKIFLRTPLDETPSIAAKQAGFFSYATERVFCLTPNHLRPGDEEQHLIRTRRRADHHDLFHLYCSIVPMSVRQIEGMTMQEWRWTEGWGLRPASLKMGLPRVRHDFVMERDGAIVGWLQVRPRMRCLILMLHANRVEEAERLLRFGVQQLSAGGPVYVPVRQYQQFLEPFLQQMEFELVAEHALLAKTQTIRVAEPKIVPMRAHASR